MTEDMREALNAMREETPPTKRSTVHLVQENREVIKELLELGWKRRHIYARLARSGLNVKYQQFLKAMRAEGLGAQRRSTVHRRTGSGTNATCSESSPTQRLRRSKANEVPVRDINDI